MASFVTTGTVLDTSGYLILPTLPTDSIATVIAVGSIRHAGTGNASIAIEVLHYPTEDLSGPPTRIATNQANEVRQASLLTCQCVVHFQIPANTPSTFRVIASGYGDFSQPAVELSILRQPV